MHKYLTLLLITALTTSCAQSQSSSEKVSLPAHEFAARIDESGEAVQLIDVRTPAEFEKGHLENAVNIDWNGPDFENGLTAMDKSKPVFVYCLSGGRSAAAARQMIQHGFGQVYELSGGIMKWRAENLPETAAHSIAGGMTLPQYEALLDSDKLVLVDFHAEWCAPCKEMKPFLEKISVEMADQLTLVRIDVDEHTALCRALGVFELPALKLYKNKQVVWEHTGLVTEEAVREQLK